MWGKKRTKTTPESALIPESALAKSLTPEEFETLLAYDPENPALKKVLGKIAKAVGCILQQVPEGEEYKNPFDYTLTEYNNLSDRERKIIDANASVLTRPTRERYFDNNEEVEWIVIAGGADQVILTSIQIEELAKGYSDDDDVVENRIIDDKAKEIDRVPFIYSPSEKILVY